MFEKKAIIKKLVVKNEIESVNFFI